MTDRAPQPAAAPDRTRRWWVRTIGVGIAAGFLSGLFGVGGGILMVPAMVLLLGMEQRRSHGTSLTAILPIAISGTIGYSVEGSVDWPVAMWLTVGSAGLGAVIGTHLLHVLPRRALAYGFAGLLVATAVRMALDNSQAGGRAGLTVATVLILVAIGVVTGTLAGLLGVGGGIVVVPVLVVGLGLPAAVAKGTSLAMVVPTSLVGTWRNVKAHNTELTTAAVMGVAGLASSFAATKISVGLDETLSNRLFGALLLLVAVSMFRKERRAARAEATAETTAAVEAPTVAPATGS
ncbi:MAG TPA: sulfite exporter TauE/SafE family protein [Iamia sp.]|nr:sulfite exporter TauE/SafE family protein [Iamia sp.]